MSTNETKSTGKSPTHVCWHVRESGNGKGYWNRIGVAWTNKDGGFTVQLESVPLNGRIVCQPADKKTND